VDALINHVRQKTKKPVSKRFDTAGLIEGRNPKDVEVGQGRERE